MNKKLILAFAIGGILGLAFTFWQRSGNINVNINPSLQQQQEETVSPDVAQTSVLTSNLEIPWSLVFLPDGRMLVTERPGRVKLINKDGSIVGDILTISEVKHQGEGGLMGIALHPNFESNNFVYLYYTYDDNGTMNKVVRYEFNNDNLANGSTLLDRIPGALNHNGGRIKFGPDKLLYITTGDSQEESSSQDRNSLAGKILRMKDDGSNMEVYSYGHRNPQGIAWHSDGRLFATEHGPLAHDEVNLVEQGKNYGWSVIRGSEQRTGMENPLIESGNGTWAPSGAVFYNGNLFFTGLRGSALFEFNPNDLSLKTHFKNEFGRIRDVVLGPDNLLYILTNNRDGRGVPKSGDDKIIIVNPSKL